MSGKADPGLVYACLSHIPLWVDYPSYVTPIYLGQAQGEGKLNLRDLAPEWEPYHAILGGTVGSFALKNYVEQRFPAAHQVGICQYRKFVSRSRISGVEAPSYRVMDMVDKDSLRLDVLTQAMLPGEQEFLLTHPFTFSHWKKKKRVGYLQDYGRSHHVADFLRFTAVAVELGAMDKTEVEPFFWEETFLPGGIELGVYPAQFWIRHITALECVVRECVRSYPVTRDGYQARAWAFCCERLGSYMLLKHFGVVGSHRLRYRRLATMFPPAWIKRIAGQLNLIVQPGSTDYKIGT